MEGWKKGRKERREGGIKEEVMQQRTEGVKYSGRKKKTLKEKDRKTERKK